MTDRRPFIALCIVLILIIAGIVVWGYFGVEEVSVTGSTHYTDEEIEDMVMKGPLGHNSLYLLLNYNIQHNNIQHNRIAPSRFQPRT